MIPTTRIELIQRIRSGLGEPVIKLNMAESQLENCVDDAIQYWSEFHHDAQDRSFIKVQITQADLDNGFITLPESVFAVLDVVDPRESGGNMSWMSGEFEIMRDTIYGATNGGMASYVLARSYIAEMEAQFRPKAMFDFRYHKHQLHIFDKLDTIYKVGDYVVLEVMGYLYKTSYNIWGDKALRRLAMAYTKKMWGMNLKKFSGVTLPSGTTLNGDAIYADALADIEEAEEFISGQQEPMGIIIS